MATQVVSEMAGVAAVIGAAPMAGGTSVGAVAAREIEREGMTAKATGMKAGGAKAAAGGGNQIAVATKGASVASTSGTTKIAMAGVKGSTIATAGGAGAVGAAAATGSTLAPSVTPVAAAFNGGTMLTTKGVSLGLGLGLGAWGPVLLGIVGVAGAVSLYDFYKSRRAAEPAAEIV